MDSGEFDKIIKKNLGNYSSLPKREVKRAVFGFLFFQNLWVFHKLKLFSILSIAIGLSLGLLLQNDDKNIQDFSELDFENNQKPLLKSLNEPFFSNGSENREIIGAKNNDPLNSGKSIANNELIPPTLNQKNTLDFVPKKNESQPSFSENSSKLLKKKNKSFRNNENKVAPTNVKSIGLNTKNGVDEKKINPIKAANSDYSVAKFEEIERVEELSYYNTESENEIGNKLLDSKIQIKAAIPLTLKYNIDSVESVPLISAKASDYFNNKSKRGWSIDAYFSPFSRVDIDNKLVPSLQDYWWDFYKEYDMKKSGFSGGFNVSYNLRNFKINSGFNLIQISDYKPTYEYYTEVDSIFVFSSLNELSLFSIDYISGLQVFGQDTAVILYVDPNDSRLIDEINNQDANRYTYFKIPLTLGYEFSFKRFSFEINTGLEYSRLVKSSGISFKNGYVDVGIRPYPYYFYDNMVATTYSNNSQAMKINNLNYVANLISRVRLAPSIDFFSAFNFQHQRQNIMGGDYLLEKTFNRIALNFGVTYYLNSRLNLEEQIIPKFD